MGERERKPFCFSNGDTIVRTSSNNGVPPGRAQTPPPERSRTAPFPLRSFSVPICEEQAVIKGFEYTGKPAGTSYNMLGYLQVHFPNFTWKSCSWTMLRDLFPLDCKCMNRDMVKMHEEALLFLRFLGVVPFWEHESDNIYLRVIRKYLDRFGASTLYLGTYYHEETAKVLAHVCLNPVLFTDMHSLCAIYSLREICNDAFCPPRHDTTYVF